MYFGSLRMLMIRYIVYFLFLLVVFQNVNAQERTYKFFYYPDSTIASEGWVLGNKPDGYWKNYYPDGIIKSEGKRTNTMLDSIWNFYDEKGYIQQSISYLMGNKNGYTIQYYTRKDTDTVDIIKSKELYLQGLKEGNALYYSTQGILYRKIPYIKNKKEGNGIEYCNDGTPCYLLKYRFNELVEREKINQKNLNGEKIGVWKEFYDNGEVRVEQTFDNGKLFGKTKYYTSNGQLLKTEYFENDSILKNIITELDFDEPIEIIDYYDDNITVKHKGSYKDSLPIGIHRFYARDGILVNAKIYDLDGTLLEEGVMTESGVKTGNWKLYYENGTVQAIGIYVANKKQGIWKFYYRTGTIRQEGEYKNDKEEGLWIFYNEKGNILREEEYFDGYRNGSITEYNDSLQIIAKGFFVDGMKTGKWIVSIGDNKEVGEYRDDKKIGEWKHFYPDGTLRFKGNYKNGKEDGKHKYYWQSGTIEHIEIYDDGRKEKKWSYYNKRGSLIQIVIYKNDKEKGIVTYDE